MGSRSRRAPAFTIKTGSFPLVQHGKAAFRQSVDGPLAVLIVGILLRRKKEFFAAPDRLRIEAQNAPDEGVGLSDQLFGRANLRNQTDLKRAMRADGIALQ